MTREEAIKELRALAEAVSARPRWQDPETAHCDADKILLDLIDDEEVRAAYDSIEPKWYA